MPQPSGLAAPVFHTASFAVPFSVALSPMLKPKPSEQTASFVWWQSRTEPNDRVRFLHPAEYYPDGGPHAAPPPSDYPTYLRSLTAKGVRFTDKTTLTVGGRTVAVMTATATGAGLDGSLGCPDVGADQADGCYGIQPDYALRIAVLNAGGRTILAWARTSSATPNKAFLRSFDVMLRTLHFG